MLREEALRACTGYMIGRIRKICEEFGPRPPGSAGERRCQEFLRDELAAAGYAPVLEPFPVSQTAFMAAPAIAGWLGVLSVAAFWYSPLAALGLVLAAVFVFVMEIISYHHVLTPFFPRHTSHNLHAVLRPAGPVKRRIILAGHADAAFEWRYQQHFPKYFMHFGQAAVLSIVYLLLTTMAAALFCGRHAPTEGFWWWMGVSQLAALPGALIAATFTRFSVVSPGANDNLTGALASVGLAKTMKEAGVVPQNTEIIFAVTGSEEAGLCGADAFIRQHRHEWNDVETVFVAVDTLHDLDYLMVYNRDLNGSRRHDPALCDLLQDAMRRHCLDHKFGSVHVGASDAAAFTRAGLRAAALCGMDPRPADYYHCRRDRWEILNEECLFKAVQVLSSALEEYDRNGLPGTV